MAETVEKKSYYAVIPANVRYDKSIPTGARLLYGEITALCNEKGYCWAGNGYFAELYDVSERTISAWLSKLADQGYVRIEILKAEGNVRRIYLAESVSIGLEKNFYRSRRKVCEGIEEKFHSPIEKNFHHNNTDKNNKKNNTEELVSASAESACEVEIEKQLEISDEDLDLIHEFLTRKNPDYIDKAKLEEEISRQNWLFVLIYHVNCRRGYKDFYQQKYETINLQKDSKKLLESLEYGVGQVLQIMMAVLKDDFWDQPLRLSKFAQWVSVFKQEKKGAIKDDGWTRRSGKWG